MHPLHEVTMAPPLERTWSCTCPSPVVVDLTEAYLARHGVCGSVDTEHSSSSSAKQQPQQEWIGASLCHKQLLHNLEHFGWSHVSLQVSKIPCTSPLRLGGCRDIWNSGGGSKRKDAGSSSTPKPSANANPTKQVSSTKEIIAELFQPDFVNFATTNIDNNDNNIAIYRTAESGSAGEAAVEPKQSWETRRCRTYSNNNQQSLHQDMEASTMTKQHESQLKLLQDIPQALHSVATTVNWALQLPKNLLLQEQTIPFFTCEGGCICHRNCQQHQGVPPLPTSPCNIDLLRVFYYDPVPTNKQDIKITEQQHQHQSTLGSSAHTDWGSWTVVWQDQVGGLQTWCPSCQVWRNVEASFDDVRGSSNNAEDTILRFVIHVGDATSLALAHAARENQQELTQPPDESPSHPLFPSPKHRVLSPSTEPRASLVYFVYPTPGQSLESLSKGVSQWYRQYATSSKTPLPTELSYDNYYLLHDQSVSTTSNEGNGINEEIKSPKQIFEKIFQMPLNDVFAEKWQQVQRAT